MKQLLTFVLLLLSFMSIGQDTTYSLPESQIVGIRIEKREPSNMISFSTDSIEPFISKIQDPFFIIERNIPGVYAQSDNGQSNGYSYLRIRGIDQTRINFNLNGIPLNEMEDQGIYFSNMPGFYNYLGKISVQKGVGTSKYGNSSIGGSVNMETKDMTKKSIEYNSFLFGTYKNQFQNLFYSSGINKNGLALQLGGTYAMNSGFKYNSNNEGGSVFYNVGYFKKNNIIKLYGFNGISKNQLSFYGVDMATLDIDYRTNLNSITDRDTFKQNFASLNWVNISNQNVKFNTSLYYNNVNGTYNTGGLLFGVNSNQFGLMSNIVINNNVNIGFNTNIYSREHFGSDSMGYFTDQVGNYVLSVDRYENIGYKKDGTTYIKGHNKIGSINTYYDLQLRKVWFNIPNFETNWTFFNPKIGFKKINYNDDFYLNLGLTSREPTRTDIIQNMSQKNGLYGVNIDNTSNVISNYKLSPEKLFNIESGYTYHNSDIRLNTNVYLMNIKNEFVSTGNIDFYSGFMEKVVQPSTIRTGFEFQTNINISNRLSMFGNGFIQYNNIVSINKKIPFTPSYTSSFGFIFKLNPIDIGFTNLTVSSMYMNLDNTQKSQSYNITNGFVQYKLSNLTFSVKMDNLFNNKYYIPAMMIGSMPTYYVGQLYNWSINLNYKI